MASGDSVDLSGFKKKITCGGRQYDEFSNFHASMIWADEDWWPTAEHYYQALKFPGAAASELREAIRNTSSPMESWQLGNSNKSLLRKDWEEVKVNMMYQSNYLKFSQSEHLRTLIIGSNGPIVCDGGLFWKTWNEIILERIREELKGADDRKQAELDTCVALMKAYVSAASSGDPRAVEAVTRWAAKRQLPPESAEMGSVTLSGAVQGQVIILHPDLLQPEVNGHPHMISQDGDWHFYLGKKRDRLAWVLDEYCAESECTGHAFIEMQSSEIKMPCGSQQWQLWNDSVNRHVSTELVLSL